MKGWGSNGFSRRNENGQIFRVATCHYRLDGDVFHRRQLLERGETKYTVLVTLFRRSNSIFVSLRSRNGDALKVAQKFQGGGHANAAGASLPKSVRTVEDGVDFLKQMLNVKTGPALNSLDSLFAGIEIGKK